MTSQSHTTEVAELNRIFQAQRAAFEQHAPLSCARRLEALDALLQLVLSSQDAITDAINADFGQRAAIETRLLEMFPLINEIRHIKRHLARWIRPRSVPVNWQFLPSRAYVLYQPLGVVGIVGAWNYPLLLALSPLAEALAAGNHVLLKPSENAPRCAAWLQQALASIFPPEYVAVVEGDRDLSAAFVSLPFDHLLFTGSTQVGRLVMKAAAENLTPVTLELGGKSPALVHEEFPVAEAANRICSAKFWNAGQTCVAPDYALVHERQVENFAQAGEQSVLQRFPQPIVNPHYTHMSGPAAWKRMKELVEDARAKGAEIRPIGGAKASSSGSGPWPPTLILAVSDSMRVMQEEIFGPLLPVLGYSSMTQALGWMRSRPRPLAFYYFDRDSQRVRGVLEQTWSGGVTVNDCIFHLPQHDLPFGGIGHSGMGSYHGFDGFVTFSKKKGVFRQSRLSGMVMDRLFKPPYPRAGKAALDVLIGKAGKRPARRFRLDA